MNQTFIKRNKAMAKLHKKMTLRELGSLYGISAERVRQILVKQGLTYDGSARQLAANKRHQQRQAAYQDKLDDNCRRIYGVSRKALKTLPQDRESLIRRAYCNAKKNAKKQNVPFAITVLEYWQVWKTSRKFNQRGLHADQYSCTRINFNKGYIPGNLKVEKTGDVTRRSVVLRDLNRKRKLRS